MCNVAVWAYTISAKLRRWKFFANGDIIFYISGSLMPTKTARRDYNKKIPGFVTSQTQINPAPGNMQQREWGHAALL